MGSDNVWRVVGGIGVLMGIIIALIPFNLVHVCTGSIELKSGMMAPMKCHWTGIAEVVLGSLVAFNGLLLLLGKNNQHNLSWMLIALGVAIIAIPTSSVIGICMHEKMACHATKAALNISGSTLIVVSLAGQVLSRSIARKQRVLLVSGS